MNLENQFTKKAKTIIADYFHSCTIEKLTKTEKESLYKELAELWKAINKAKLIKNCSLREVEEILGKPIEQIDKIWFYPAGVSDNYYAITFENDVVSQTDFVTVKIA